MSLQQILPVLAPPDHTYLRRPQLHDCCFFFFFNDTATTEIYTLPLHDALPISLPGLLPYRPPRSAARSNRGNTTIPRRSRPRDRKSTRLNSSHSQISYAVFCLKKKKINIAIPMRVAITAAPVTPASPTSASHAA